MLSGGAGPDSNGALIEASPGVQGRRLATSRFGCTAGPKIPHLKARKIKGIRNSWFTSALLLLPRLIEQSLPSVRRPGMEET